MVEKSSPRKKPGIVTLVGAGPGDPGLMTLKGREALERADVVVYDRLIGWEILSWIPQGAERVDVGKHGGCHPVPQKETERILIEKAREGKNVVRLKGGDPFLFGRGGEEADALIKAGIPCAVVPGVSSALAVPACAGIPPTHRDCASAVHIVTACRQDGSPVNYAALARLEGTLVFMMGVKELPEIATSLITGGMDPATPAAVIQRGATARQVCLTALLKDLPGRAAAAGIGTPAVIVVGAVVNFANVLDWRAALPLLGTRVAVTRSERKNGRLAALLRARGAEVLEVPCIRTETLNAPLPPLSGYGRLVFTSPTGVESFFERLQADRRDIRETGNARIAAVGPATRAALESRGLMVDLVPDVYGGEALAEALIACNDGGTLLLLRAEQGAPELPRMLKEGGVFFEEILLYRTVPANGDPAIAGLLEDTDAAVFACASSVRVFAAAWPGLEIPAVCIGERTTAAAREAGYKTYTAKAATLENLADAVVEFVENINSGGFHKQC